MNNVRTQPWDGVEAAEPDMKNFVPTLTFAFVRGDYKTPLTADQKAKLIAAVTFLYKKGYTYRTSNSGDDIDDEICGLAPSLSKIEKHLMFNSKKNPVAMATTDTPTKLAYSHAMYYRNNFDTLSDVIKKLIGRTVHIMLGAECNAPLKVLIVLTANGVTVISKDVKYADLGSASQYMRIADTLPIVIR